MPVSGKLLRTSTFRLAALYLIVFTLSTGAVLGYVYWNTAVLFERQTDLTIQAEVRGLADQYRLRGLVGIADTIRRRGQEGSGSLYLLLAPDGERVIGNLDSLPGTANGAEASFIEFPFSVNTGGGAGVHRARGFHSKLSGGYQLLVGRDIENLRQFRTLVRTSLAGALGLALLLGLGGALLMSRNFLKRIDSITAASRAIMAGDLAGRMPVAGTGDELDRLAQSLNEMLDQIERLMAGMREVTSNVAHDLRTPLTRMRARVESALRSGSVDEHRAALEQTIEESDRLLHTFNALLSIARAEAGQSREEMVPVDAGAIVREVAELYEPIAEAQGGTLDTWISDGLTVRADRQLLAQAVTNLLDNALKYGVSGDEPHITVSAGREGGMIAIAIADRGAGIPQADRMRVIDRFVRLDESRSKPGSGLGLSLVAGVMKLHGGRLLLEENAPGLKAKLLLPPLDEKPRA